MISLIFIITLFLLIFFKTDAFIVYSKLFKVNKFFYIDEWEKFKNEKDITTTYHQYLRIKYPNGFWVKLITCPICLCVWLCLPILFIKFYLFPIICVSSLFLYYLIIKLM